MSRIAPIALAALAIAASTGPASAAPEVALRAGFEACGDIEGTIVSDVFAKRVSCETARAVAHRYAYRTSCYQHGCRVGTYRCRKSDTGYESHHARCVSGRRVIGFDYGL